MSSYLTSALSGTASINMGCLAAKLTMVAAIIPNFHPCAYVGNAPLATVMVEIVLYAGYAAVFVLIRTRSGVTIFGCLCGTAGAIYFAIAGLGHSQPILYNWLQNSSYIGFLPFWWIGALVLHPDVEEAIWRWRTWLLGAWIVLTALLFAYGPATALSELRKAIFALLVGLLICVVERVKISERNPIASLGRAGYSIYAFHGPLTYLLVVAGAPWWLTFVCAVIFGVVMFILVERPIMNLGSELSRPRGTQSMR